MWGEIYSSVFRPLFNFAERRTMAMMILLSVCSMRVYFQDFHRKLDSDAFQDWLMALDDYFECMFQNEERGINILNLLR